MCEEVTSYYYYFFCSNNIILCWASSTQNDIQNIQSLLLPSWQYDPNMIFNNIWQSPITLPYYVCLISAWFTSSPFQFLLSALFPERLHLLINSCPTLYLTSHCFTWTTGYQLIAQVLLMIGIKTFFSTNFDPSKYVHTSTPKFRFHSKLHRSLTRVFFLSCL